MTIAAAGTPLPPGSTIGILGGGQLGRMLAMAAARLGFRCHIFAPEADGPAFDVAAAHTVAAFDDLAALDAFAAAIDVATFEFENIPVATVERMSRTVGVAPGAKALACAHDRLAEKTLARGLGAATADFATVDDLRTLEAAIARIGTPSILKTRRFGYDGKGQAKVVSPADAARAWEAMRGAPAILEAFVPFTREISVIAARTQAGDFRAFDATENEHRHHILHRSLAPARISGALQAAAVDVARNVGRALDYVGVFAVEFFVDERSPDRPLLVNEIAPRVHNSGHWTIEGAATSQFEQHIRAIAGWPLGSTARRAPVVEMINLIGADIEAWQTLAADPGAAFHHYGKAQARPGRKVGHVTRLLQRESTDRARGSSDP